MDAEGLSPLEAAKHTMKEITPAIVTITLVHTSAGLPFVSCGVPTTRTDEVIPPAGVKNSNGQWPELFKPAELATLERVLGPLLRELGYPV